jgi:type VI secretion system protein ImpA
MSETGSTVDIDAMLLDVKQEDPCGPNLEYDPEFLELEAAILGKPEVQYGDTVTPAVPPEWKVVRRLASSLLQRSRDLRLAMALTRAELALGGIPGLAAGLALIERLLAERWDHVHPQLDPDDDMDPMLRINSLATLTDPAFLAEVREVTLLVLPGLGPFSLRDLDIARGELPAPEGLAAVTVASIESALRDAAPDAVQAVSAALNGACASVVQIEMTLVRQVGSSQALNLDGLTRMLRRGRDFFNEQAAPASAAAAPEPVQADATASVARVAGAAISGDIASREDVLRMLDKIAAYYRQHEPSSPVPLLLARARRLVPKDFFEILEDLAPEGMNQLLVVSGPRPESPPK